MHRSWNTRAIVAGTLVSIYLILGGAAVPQSSDELPAGSSCGGDHVDLQPRPPSGTSEPVSLSPLFPGDQHELAVALVVEDKADVVVVFGCGHVEGSRELYTGHGVVANQQTGVRVYHLVNFCTL